jgi:putative transposase
MKKTKKTNDIPTELLDQLLASYSQPEDLTGPNGLLKRLTGALVERALNAEMKDHLGYEPHAVEGRGTGNSRNGTNRKTLKTEQGEIPIEVPRDRQGTFEPKLVGKHQTRFTGFDDKILSMYARGMSVRDIGEHLGEMYGTEVSPDLISSVTDAVIDEVTTWQNRALEPVWPVIFLDALVIKVREQSVVQNKSVYLALGVGMDGRKEILGMWIESTEGAKFWLHIITELKNRGIDDLLIACCDGLKGFPEAIEAVFPRTTVQTCIVHLIRSSTRLVRWNDRKPLIASLRMVYAAATEQAALAELDAFEDRWKQRYPSVAKAWRARWELVRPFFAFAPEIRRMIYTTNAIESLNYQLRKVTKAKGHFPNDMAAIKILFLALRNVEKKWRREPYFWKSALSQLAIHFEGRLPE